MPPSQNTYTQIEGRWKAVSCFPRSMDSGLEQGSPYFHITQPKETQLTGSQKAMLPTATLKKEKEKVDALNEATPQIMDVHSVFLARALRRLWRSRQSRLRHLLGQTGLEGSCFCSGHLCLPVDVKGTHQSGVYDPEVKNHPLHGTPSLVINRR